MLFGYVDARLNSEKLSETALDEVNPEVKKWFGLVFPDEPRFFATEELLEITAVVTRSGR